MGSEVSVRQRTDSLRKRWSCGFSIFLQSGSQRDYWSMPCGDQCWRTGQRPLEWDAGIPTQAHRTLASISGGKEVFQRGVWSYSFLLKHVLCMTELVQGFQRASTLTWEFLTRAEGIFSPEMNSRKQASLYCLKIAPWTSKQEWKGLYLQMWLLLYFFSFFFFFN